jgi:ABC-type polysaccharide/polyol phosphate transport system ATPase subunit
MSNSEQAFAVRIKDLSKMYRIYRQPYDMLWEVIAGKPRYREFWGLKDVSFNVRQGEVAGIIGRNGSGKSTLLKIIAGTLDKTSGIVEVKGKVSAILELGTGFNPEYTGRQNIFMGGLCLGMSREEIEEKTDWIIEFSELRAVIDQIFRTYSTGMQARLTFATAVSVNPDILIIDEALSVGDAKFQRKCFAQLQELRDRGKTILFVSHDINAINYLCDNTILLDKGNILGEGEPGKITRLYNKLLFGENNRFKNGYAGEISAKVAEEDKVRHNIEEQSNLLEQEQIEQIVPQKLSFPNAPRHPDELRYGNKKAEIIDYGIVDMAGGKQTILNTGQDYTIFSKILCHEKIEDIHLGFGIKNVKGMDLFAINTFVQKVHVNSVQKGDMLEGTVKITMWLGPGDYFLYLSVWGMGAANLYDRRIDALYFKVIGECNMLPESIVNLNANLAVKYLDRVTLG